MQVTSQISVPIPGERCRITNTGSAPVFVLASGFPPSEPASKTSGWVVNPGGKVEFFGTQMLFTNFLNNQKGTFVIYPLSNEPAEISISQF